MCCCLCAHSDLSSLCQKEKLDAVAECEVAECEIDWVSACHEVVMRGLVGRQSFVCTGLAAVTNGKETPPLGTH